MRDAETILNIIRERGCKRRPLRDVYRQLYNPELYLIAYGRIYRNAGAMTKGGTDETADGMSREKINQLIEKIRWERYRWTPVRRTYIPKRNGKNRPLGLPTWSDKLLQEVIRAILEAYYEPQFSQFSHGFRPNKGCHTALQQIKRVWHGTKWFVEGDIKGCFDNINHSTLLRTLEENISDNRFIRLIQNLLKAGYLENWNYKPTLSGTPQGGIVSPILSNIYLDKLDKFVEQTLIPEYMKGDKRSHNPEYDLLSNRAYRYRKEGMVREAKQLERARRSVPANNPNDPFYKRLRYVRYADDFLLGYVGSRKEAVMIKGKLQSFLRHKLQLELSEEKTLITHATTEKAHFLGYDISVTYCNSKISGNRRALNGGVALRIPTSFVATRSRFYMKGEKATHRMERTHDSDYSMIHQYQAEYRGIVQYYQLAENIAWLANLHWIMQTSLLKTLAHKYKSSVKKMARKYKAKVETAHGPRTCLKVIVPRDGKQPLMARFGGIPLRTEQKAVIKDQQITQRRHSRNELLKRLLADTCESCESQENIEVHHVRKLADVNPKGRKAKPDWMHLMVSRRRKTLVLCRRCHDNLHAGRPLRGGKDTNYWRAV